MTCGIPYKFDLLKSPKISKLWENYCHFLLAYLNSTKPVALERGNIMIPPIEVLFSEGNKFHI